VLNLPGTYPRCRCAEDGIRFVAPEFDKACYPATFAQTLKTLVTGWTSTGRWGSPGLSMSSGRSGGVRGAQDRDPPPHQERILGPVHRGHHGDRSPPALLSPCPGRPWSSSASMDPALLRRARRLHRRGRELVDGKADLFMVSDHASRLCAACAGGGLPARSRPRACVGSAVLVRPAIAAKTHVFCLDPGRFYINRKGGRFQGRSSASKKRRKSWSG